MAVCDRVAADDHEEGGRVQEVPEPELLPASSVVEERGDQRGDCCQTEEQDGSRLPIGANGEQEPRGRDEERHPEAVRREERKLAGDLRQVEQKVVEVLWDLGEAEEAQLAPPFEKVRDDGEAVTRLERITEASEVVPDEHDQGWRGS